MSPHDRGDRFEDFDDQDPSERQPQQLPGGQTAAEFQQSTNQARQPAPILDPSSPEFDPDEAGSIEASFADALQRLVAALESE